ncbi:MAG: oligosaccharyl transferase, archaeosortase A system-associated [Euryarchaeota archaeon]|nr:oligosaccharyl transferase, archaeosortase A system-associated [Euryarchaeota archaeon]
MYDELTERVERLSESDNPARTLLERAYHIPVLIALMVIMLATRLRALENFQTNGGVTFRGNDPWYHFRQTSYLLDNFPWTMPFDPLTNYPSGTTSPQFGTLYDQIVSGFILLTSFGNPSGEYAGVIMLIAAPVFATAAVVPAYYIAARFAGRGPALVGVVVFALLPGTFLNYSLVGFYDHHAAEVFFQTLGVLGFVVALSVAQREQPVWELVADRDLDALRRPLAYSVAAGAAAALYMWAWPPGVLLVGFTGIFFAIKLTSDVYHGSSPEPIAFVGAVSMTVTGLLMFVPLDQFTIGSATSNSLLHVILPLGVAFGCVFLGVLARVWEAREIGSSLYPVAVGGILAVLAGLFSSFVQSLSSTLISRVGFSASATAQTVGEAAPPLSRQSAFNFIYTEYGLAFFTAVIAAIVVLARPLIRSDDIRDTGYVVGSLATIGLIYLATPVFETIAGVFGTSWQIIGLLIASGILVGATLRHRYDAAELYLIVWAAFITSAAFTQVRFNYYLAVVVAVFTAIFVGQVFGYLDVAATGESLQTSIQSLEGWQVMVAVAVLLVVTAPLLVPFAGSAWATADRNGPGAVTQWDDTFEWMSSETPQPGELGGADNAMEHYGAYDRPDDGDFDYPEGAYGVQSWWDYGHWITTQGERIPNANPFQQGATEAANYLLAPSEQEAADALNEKMGEDGQTRYVMVDWEMVSPSSKFGAPIVFNDNVSQSDFIEQAYPLVQGQQGQQQLGQPITLRTQRYYDSQMIRLYNYHGSAVDPDPIVVETEPQTAQTSSGQQVTVPGFDPESGVQTFDTLDEARDYVNETPNAQLGGIGTNPTERVDALEHYRLVNAAESNALRSSRDFQSEVFYQAQATNLDINQVIKTSPSWVKTFERVPGATVDGTGAEPGTEVRATVEMEIPESGETFTYSQYATADAEGNFEMTLPYSTTGYDEFGPENGYTNTSVQATGQYVFSSDTGEGGTASVEEAQVVGVDDSAVDVELTDQSVDVPESETAVESGA